MKSSDNFLREAQKGDAEIPFFPELADPRSLVTLAATALNSIHPNADRMGVLLACHSALRQLVNLEIIRREDIVEKLYPLYQYDPDTGKVIIDAEE